RVCVMRGGRPKPVSWASRLPWEFPWAFLRDVILRRQPHFGSARVRGWSRRPGLPTRKRLIATCNAPSTRPRLRSPILNPCSPIWTGSNQWMPLMDGENIATRLARYPSADRIGFARLTAMAFGGADLRPLRDQLIGRLADGTAEAGEGLDLSLIAQLLGDKQTGMAIQAQVLASHQLYRSPCSSEQPKLRVLALAAATDMGGNTPIEFLLERSGIELTTLYVMPDAALPAPLPDHDLAIV